MSWNKNKERCPKHKIQLRDYCPMCRISVKRLHKPANWGVGAMFDRTIDSEACIQLSWALFENLTALARDVSALWVLTEDARTKEGRAFREALAPSYAISYVAYAKCLAQFRALGVFPPPKEPFGRVQ